jgi:single-strand DNA-binding protein
MAGSVNKVILIGNLGRDPEIRDGGHSGKIANLSLATSETWKDKSGERKERTEWNRVSVFGDKLVDNIGRYCSKGDMIYVEGTLRTRKWTNKQGQDQYTTEVIVSGYNGSVTFLSPPKGGGQSQPQSRENFSREKSAPRDDWRDDGGPPLNDEIPF